MYDFSKFVSQRKTEEEGWFLEEREQKQAKRFIRSQRVWQAGRGSGASESGTPAQCNANQEDCAQDRLAGGAMSMSAGKQASNKKMAKEQKYNQ